MNPFPSLNPQQNQLLENFFGLNPPVGSTRNGAQSRVCSIDRVMLAGGQLTSYMVPESIVPLEHVFRRLPEEGVFEATPSKPCQIVMGTLALPPTMGFVLLDYNFAIYRPSGSAADDVMPLEENRLATQVGWDIQSNATRQGNYHYEITPIPASTNSTAYQPTPNAGLIPGGPAQPASQDQFTAARYAQTQSAVGDALSLMPQRHHRQGLLHVPAPWILHSSQSLTQSVKIIKAVPIPLAFFESSIFGVLLPDEDLLAMQRAIAPCPMPPGGV